MGENLEFGTNNKSGTLTRFSALCSSLKKKERKKEKKGKGKEKGKIWYKSFFDKIKDREIYTIGVLHLRKIRYCCFDSCFPATVLACRHNMRLKILPSRVYHR